MIAFLRFLTKAPWSDKAWGFKRQRKKNEVLVVEMYHTPHMKLFCCLVFFFLDCLLLVYNYKNTLNFSHVFRPFTNFTMTQTPSRRAQQISGCKLFSSPHRHGGSPGYYCSTRWGGREREGGRVTLFNLLIFYFTKYLLQNLLQNSSYTTV